MYFVGFCDKIFSGDIMRLRNVKNKEEIMSQSDYLIRNPKDYKGKWSELFHNHHPILIEIGMGKGKFLIENALRYPENNYIGIEKYDSVIVKGLQKIKTDIPNLIMVRADAKEIDLMFDHEVDCIYLNFSDPWPKKRHSERRLTSTTFLKKYDNIFKNNKSFLNNLDLLKE